MAQQLITLQLSSAYVASTGPVRENVEFGMRVRNAAWIAGNGRQEQPHQSENSESLFTGSFSSSTITGRKSARYRRRPLRHICASLGFTADPRVGIERAANGLLKDAAMLLVYQDVFRSPPAQAFLKVLLALRRGDDGLKILESYGEFFKLMAVGRYPSWEDYVLEGILAGENNPFVEAAANVGNPRSAWSGGVPPSLQAAAAADLDSLQRLSITESTLSGWVAEMVADVKPEWRTAAASNFSSKTVYKAPAYVEEGNNAFGFSIPDESKVDNGLSASEVDQISPGKESESGSEDPEGIENAPGRYLKTIHTVLDEDRERWRKKIGGLWRWSEAVPLLEKYYADHSVGRIAATQFLQWKSGKLMMDTRWVVKTSSACDLSLHKAKKELLVKNVTKHAQRRTAHHILLYGPTGVGKTWLLRSVLSEVTNVKDLRIVTLPVAELKSISTVLEELARHWRLRFALVIDDLFSRGAEENYSHLRSSLDGNLQEWPENVLLCCTSPRKVASPGKDGAAGSGDLSHLFGFTVEFADLDENDFVRCVKELLENRIGNTSFDTNMSREEVVEQAKVWAERISAKNVRSVAQFVNALDE
ncbi:hypothetical protein R1sor_013114 [Riccia sorocarpa]|uniref:AAA+ ATPase domain-containing protein n=1 Tax=Riccia sorocarpa TaxID=122646 RepID=A0ABD3H5K5_9MARC